MKHRLPFVVAMVIAVLGALWGSAYADEILKGYVWWHTPAVVTAILVWVFGWMAMADWS